MTSGAGLQLPSPPKDEIVRLQFVAGVLTEVRDSQRSTTPSSPNAQPPPTSTSSAQSYADGRGVLQGGGKPSEPVRVGMRKVGWMLSACVYADAVDRSHPRFAFG